MKHNIVRILKYLFPFFTLLSLAIIFGNSMAPAQQSDLQRGDFFEWLEKIVGFFAGREIDISSSMGSILSKVAHLTEFFVFSFCFSMSVLLLRCSLKEQNWKILFCGLFTALTDEHLQSIFSGRNPSVSDVMIDFSGVLIGYASVFLITLLRKERKP